MVFSATSWIPMSSEMTMSVPFWASVVVVDAPAMGVPPLPVSKMTSPLVPLRMSL